MGSAAASPPPSAKPTQDEVKRAAAHRAVELVEPAMTLGLGTGSTAAHALDRLGDLLRAGALPGVAGVPTSLETEAHAARVGIPLLPLDAASGASIALSIDGADEEQLREKKKGRQTVDSVCDGLIALFRVDFGGRGEPSVSCSRS